MYESSDWPASEPIATPKVGDRVQTFHNGFPHGTGIVVEIRTGYEGYRSGPKYAVKYAADPNAPGDFDLVLFYTGDEIKVL